MIKPTTSKTKILLIQPTPYAPDGTLIKKKRLYFVGLALPLLAALTPDTFNVEICYETIEEVPLDTDAHIIGISSMGHGVHRTIDLAKHFKAMGKVVVLGGYMVSLMPQEAQKYCDAVFVGDSEATWPAFLKDFQQGTLKPLYQQALTEDTYKPPIPRYDLITSKAIGNFLPVQAGRGCINTCSFCSIACLYKGHYYRRPLEDVLRDIQVVKDLGYNQFLLLDDNLFSDRTYSLDLCSRLAPLKMKWMTQCDIQIGNDHELLEALRKAGCFALSFGLESIEQTSLDALQKPWAKVEAYTAQLKNIRNHGIALSTEMVIGADGDTLSSIKRTAKAITQWRIAVPRFYILTPIPGTLYYQKMAKEERLYMTDIYKYTGDSAVHIPKNMSPEALTLAYWQLYKSVYSLSSILRRTLFTRDLLRYPIRTLFYLYINLYYKYHISRGITPNII